MTVVQREAKRFDVGADTPLQSSDPKVFEVPSALSMDCDLVRERLDGLGGFTTEEGCITDQNHFIFLIALKV